MNQREQASRSSDSAVKTFLLDRVLLLVALASLCAWLIADPGVSQAQTPPITSSGLNTQVGPATTLPNGKINYDLTGGTRPGNGPNLFHSFGLFNVPTNNIANFLNETNLPTSNILSRVTGGNPSSIFGTIQTTGFGNANLFLINPAGVLFGPTASLKVGGSFHVSTADYLRLTDGVRFNALPGPQDALLSTAPVAAFGFLNPNPAPISVQGSALAVPEGQTLSLIGGDISIQGNAELTNFGIATLDAPRGQILLASVASAGEVILGPVEQGKGLQMEGFNALGKITVAPGSLINTAGESGGTVVIRGGEFTIDGSFIFSDTLGGQNGAPLAIDAQLTGAAHIVNGSQITADIVGRGNAGDIVMAAKSLTIEGENSAVHSIDFGGAGGATANIVVHANDLVLTSGGAIYTTTSGSGNAGNITLNVGTLTTSVYDPLATSVQATIESLSFGFTTPPGLADGKAGDITITASGPIILNNTSVVSNGCFCVPGFGFGTGQGGSITLTSGPGPTSQIALNETNVSANVNDLAPGASSGTPSRITVTADTLSMTGNFPLSGGISSQTFGSAPAGNIVLNVKTLRSFPGVADGITVAGIASLTGNGVNSPTAGPAGNITIKGPDPNNPNDAATLIDLNGGAVATSSFGRSPGASAGNVTITADTVILTRMGGATNFRGEVVQTGGCICSDSEGPAPAGNIIFNVRTLLSNVTRDGTLLPATAKDLIPTPQFIVDFDNLPPGTWVDQNVISSQSSGQFVTLPKNSNPHDPMVGRPGSVIIKGPDPTNPNDAATLVALNNTLLETTMSGGTSNTPPGHINISADILSLTNGTQVLADTSGGAPAGNITLNVGTLTSNIQMHGLGKPMLDLNGNLVPNNATAPVLIKSTSTGPGQAGTITIRGTDSTDTVSTPAALVALNNTTLSTVAGDAVSSSAMPAHISIIAGTVNVSNSTQITADTSGAAPAGDITLTATETLSLAGGSSLLASTHSSGNAGQVLVTTPTLTMDNGHIETNTDGTGDAGTVTLNTNQLMMQSGSQIATSTSGVGNAGSVTVQGQHSPADSVIIDGAGSGIFTETQGAGAGGGINISAQSFTVQNGGTLSATTSSSGNAGSITANVGGATLTNNAKISSSSTGSSASDPLQPFGNAGTVSLNVSGTFQSSNSSVTTSVQQGKGTTGTPSTITITAGQDLNLTSETTVSTLSDGLKTDAGAITLTAGNTLFLSDSHVTSKASNPAIANNPALAQNYTASGGDIKLTAPNMIHLVNGEVVASVQGNVTTSGGNINIDPQFVILQNSKILANADAGTGGNITITAGVFLADVNSKVDASSAKGINGEVSIQAPVTNLSGTLAPLPADIVQVAALLQARCAARLAGGTSGSFVVAGRDGLPLEPGGLLPSPLYVESERTTRLAESLGLPALQVGRPFMESNLTLVPLAIGCSS